MFNDANSREVVLDDIALKLKSFIGRKLIQVRFKESNNAFLLLFSDLNSREPHSAIHLFNCFLFTDDGVFGLPIAEAHIKSLAVLAYEYCNRHGINPEAFFELKLIAKNNEIEEDSSLKLLIVGCERITISENVSNTREFWEI